MWRRRGLWLACALGLMACGGDGDGDSPAGPGSESPEVESATPGAAGGEVFAVSLPGGGVVELELVRVEAGTFLMGSPLSEAEREENEGPQHEVTFSRGFWLGRCEVTQGQWEAVMNTAPWSGQAYVVEDPKSPAVYVTWDDAQAFVRRLNEMDGSQAYRLPTEAEWEYACRAGTSTRWSFGDDVERLGDYAWYKFNAWDVGEQYGHPVETRLPNPWGLYDMHGNVWEWVQDWFSDTYYSESPGLDPQGAATGTLRGYRGADFHYYPRGLRSARRGRSEPGFARSVVGFRLLRQEP